MRKDPCEKGKGEWRKIWERSTCPVPFLSKQVRELRILNHIIDCLGVCLSKRNRKLESVFEDCRSDAIDHQIIVLGELCAGLVIVTERQLADFLPEGRYHSVPENNPLRGKIKHSHLTNLIGEQMFGDLDFSLFKRRSAFLFHHSTINILKRNRSVSAWFLKKSNEEQAKLLNLSAKGHQRPGNGQLRKKGVQWPRE
ncbi:hypothetical protein LSH36_1525g00035, partial [Paralvinella palmiformis]